MSQLCPRCERDSLSDGVCLHCGPDAHVERVAAGRVHEGWIGHDRDLGAMKRRAQVQSAKRQAEDERRRGAGGWIAWGIAALLFMAGGVWVARRGDPAPLRASNPALPPTALHLRSHGRGELALMARALHELAADAERRLAGNPDASKADVQRFRRRLTQLHAAGRELEPKLTRDESRALMAIQAAERHLEAFLKSFDGARPDLEGARVEAAREQLDRALALARGEKVDDAVITFRKKASAASALDERLDRASP